MKKLIILSILFLPFQVLSQKVEEILKNTINYHDPNGEWKTLKATFEYAEKQPDGTVRKTILKLNNAANSHYINRGDKEAYQVNGKMK